MKKILPVLAFAGFLLIPAVTHADPYSGAYYAKVIQAPTFSCHYAVLGDNMYEYDLVNDDFTDDLANGNYLYGELELGTQFAYNVTTGQALTYYVEDTMMSWSEVVSRYYEECPPSDY